MPFDLTALRTGVAECTSALGITVTYRLANVTENTAAQLMLLADKDKPIDMRQMKALTRIICQLVLAWDLTDHGVPVPLTRAAVADVPAEIRADVIGAIFQDARLGESNGMPSPRPSPAPSGPAKRGSSKRRAQTASRTRW